MSDRFVLVNVRLPLRSGRYQIAIANHQIQSVDSMTEPMTAAIDSSIQTIDIAGDWISLGAVDLQINGALGLAFPDLRAENLDKLQAICELLWRQGVDGFCPTLVTTSLENFRGSLRAIARFQAQQFQSPQPHSQAAKILGVHLEGPFLNIEKRGAHPAEYLQPLSLKNVKAVIEDFADEVSIMTLAPELAKDTEVIEWLVSQGITVSLGHSLATAKQAHQAFEQGATMVTHAFNAMPGLHHREPGILGAALVDPRVSCGFIADGQHICFTMLDLLMRIGRGSSDDLLGGLFLVSDALSPLGLPDGKYPWDEREIEVINGTARLADGTLSGTTLPLIAGAKNLVEWGLCSVEEAIALVTQAPRQALGLPEIGPGVPASLLRWQEAEGSAIAWQRLTLDKSPVEIR